MSIISTSSIYPIAVTGIPGETNGSNWTINFTNTSAGIVVAQNLPVIPNTPPNYQPLTGTYDASNGILNVQLGNSNGNGGNGAVDLACSVASNPNLGVYLSCPNNPTNVATINRLVASVNAKTKNYAENTTSIPTSTSITPVPTAPAMVISNNYNLIVWLIVIIIIIFIIVLVNKNSKNKI